MRNTNGVLCWFTGAEGSTHYIDTHHKTSSPNGGIAIEPKYSSASGYLESEKRERRGDFPMKIPNSFHPNLMPNFRHHPYRSIQGLSITQGIDTNDTTNDLPLKWLSSSGDHQRLRESPIDYESTRGQPMKIQSHHQMSYHNMFTPSQEQGTLWRCRSCNKEVTNRWHHFHSHTAQRSMCPYCPATYSRIDTLRSHLKQKHKDHVHAHKSF